MEQDDLEITSLADLPAIQQKMLEGRMEKPKGVALVQADRAGRTIASYEAAFLGELLRQADPAGGSSPYCRTWGTRRSVQLPRDGGPSIWPGRLYSGLNMVPQRGRLFPSGGKKKLKPEYIPPSRNRHFLRKTVGKG